MEISATPSRRTFTLTLTESEAGVLLKIVGRITGSASASPRGFCSEMFDELIALKVKPVGEIRPESSLSFLDDPRTSDLV